MFFFIEDHLHSCADKVLKSYKTNNFPKYEALAKGMTTTKSSKNVVIIYPSLKK